MYCAGTELWLVLCLVHGRAVMLCLDCHAAQVQQHLTDTDCNAWRLLHQLDICSFTIHISRSCIMYVEEVHPLCTLMASCNFDLVLSCRLQSQKGTVRKAAPNSPGQYLQMGQPCQQSAPGPATQTIQMQLEATDALLLSKNFSTIYLRQQTRAWRQTVRLC